MKTIDQKWNALTKTHKAVLSCKTPEQAESCRNLIRNYVRQFNKDFPSATYEAALLNEILDEK
jgi:hypothetical protein